MNRNTNESNFEHIPRKALELFYSNAIKRIVELESENRKLRAKVASAQIRYSNKELGWEENN